MKNTCVTDSQTQVTYDWYIYTSTMPRLLASLSPPPPSLLLIFLLTIYIFLILFNIYSFFPGYLKVKIRLKLINLTSSTNLFVYYKIFSAAKKTHFNLSWLNNPKYANWVVATGDSNSVSCKLCN